MSSKFATLFILVSLCRLSFSQAPTKQEISKAGIKTRIDYLYIENDVESSPLSIHTESYDTLGNLMTHTYSSYHDKTVIVKENFFYNERGQLYKKELIRYSNWSLDSALNIFLYEYNENGLPKNGDYDRPIEYIFDSLGRVAEMIVPYPGENPCLIKTTYTYSNSGLLIKETQFETLNNRNSYATFHKYDSDGKLSSTRYRYFHYYSEPKPQVSEHKMKYFYDSNGLLVKTIQRQTKFSKYETKASNRITVFEYQYY